MREISPSTAAPSIEPTLRGIRTRLTARPGLMTVRSSFFVAKLAEQAAMFGAGSWLVLGTQSLVAAIAGVGLLGATYARNLELMHECMHFLAFRSRRTNRFFGVLLGLPMLTSFEEWRYSHLQHHADVRNEGFQFNLDEIDSLAELLFHYLMVNHYRDAFKKMYRALRGGVDAPTAIRRAVNRNYQLMFTMVGAMTLASIVLESWIFVLLWLLPLIVAGVVNFHIQLPEHYQCDTTTNDAMRNSRTIQASRIAAWFVNNNNFHTSHHWIPTAPIRQLRKIDVEIRQFVQTAGESYPQFYRNYYARLWKNLRTA
jgi:fatty acid desaturase